MEELYSKLNFYLNEIFKYLESNHLFFVRNLKRISILNDAVYEQIKKYPLDYPTRQNTMTWEDVCLLAREIIEKIDEDYLTDFDRILINGELEFIFEKTNGYSSCSQLTKNGEVKKQTIDIKRLFNYDDVASLVHEFIHYTNGEKKSQNREVMTEFLSIYFEFYALDYMLQKGIPCDEIGIMFRFESFKHSSLMLMSYEIVLLAYEQFGQLSSSTIEWLNKYVCDIKKEAFEHECMMLCDNLDLARTRTKEKTSKNPERFGENISDEFISQNYLYVLGTILAIYARKYAKFEDVVALNNHILEYDEKSISEICMMIGIDLNESDFQEKVMLALDEYMGELQTYAARNTNKDIK